KFTPLGRLPTSRRTTGKGGPMKQLYCALIGASMVAACGGKKNDQVAADSTGRSIELTTPDSTLALNDAPSGKTDTVYLPQPTPPKTTTPKRNPPAAQPAPVPPPAATPSPAPAPTPTPVISTLSAGTVVETRISKPLSSRTNKAGE